MMGANKFLKKIFLLLLGIIMIGAISCITIEPPIPPYCTYNINNDTADTICVRVVYTDSIELIQSVTTHYAVRSDIYEQINIAPDTNREVLWYEHNPRALKNEAPEKHLPAFLPTEIIDSIIILNTNDEVLLEIANNDSLWEYRSRLVSKEFYPGEYYIFYDFTYPIQK